MLTYLHMVTQVDIWTAKLDSTEIVWDFREVLSPDELQRAERLLFKKDRYSFLISRSILRSVLAEYLGATPDSILFAYSKTGKPELAGVHSGRIHFSLSHSENFVLYAFTRSCDIGVDVEFVKEFPDLEDIAIKHFPSHQTALRSLPARLKATVFYELWTRREALIKGMGKGLAAFEDDAVHIGLHQSKQSILSDLDKKNAAEWSIINMYPLPDYVAAVAVKNSNITISYHTYDSKLLAAA